MYRIAAVCIVALLLSAPQSHHAQVQIEQLFLDTRSPERAKQWLFALTEEPHVAGTPAQLKVVEFVRDRFKEFGLETEVVKYDVFINYPKSVSLRMTSPREEKRFL